MPDATRCAAARPCSAVYCDRCDLLVGLDGLRVAGVERRGDGVLVIDAESPPGPVGCPECGVVAESAGRKVLVLTDAPMGGTPVRVRWRKRRWRCRQDGCGVRSFTEQNPAVAAANKALTARAVAWAVAQMRRENASVQGVARQLGVSGRTVWRHVKPVLETRAADESRFDGVTTLGVDEHMVIKTLIFEDERSAPLCILMHGDNEVSAKNLARFIGCKSVAPCAPAVADRHSGYQVGGTSPFGLRKAMPVYMQQTIAELPKIYINGGARGFLVEIAPADLQRVLQPTLVDVAT